MRELDWKSFDVLVVDDEEDNLDAFRFTFRKSFNLHYAVGGDAALALLGTVDPAVIVSDQRMPGMSGIELLRRAKELRPDAVGILLTAYADLPVLVDAINSGAVERYMQKPWDSKELTVVLRQAIGSFATVRENQRLREQVAQYAGYLEREQRDPIDFGELQGPSPAARELSARIDEVAPTRTHVLIEGEPGTEREIVARAIHVGSPREERPFVKVTCAAFQGDAKERELFGWSRGAFEGAFTDRPGRIELAHGGTIYLEEPEDLSPSLQARLLRVLVEGETERVGATRSAPIDVRILVGVTPRLAASWSEGALLPELASRLSVFPLRVPPLRERAADVGPLAQHFLRKYARKNARAATSFSPEALDKLASYGWPGNARELENTVERAAILARGDVIAPSHLAFAAEPRAPAPPSVRGEPSPESSAPKDLDSKLDAIERRELLAAIARCSGNKAEVARSLGVRRTTLYYRMKRLGIEL